MSPTLLETHASPRPMWHENLVLIALGIFCAAEMAGLAWTVGLYFPNFGNVAGCMWAIVSIFITAALEPPKDPPWLVRLKRFGCWLLMTGFITPGLFLGSFLASRL